MVIRDSRVLAYMIMMTASLFGTLISLKGFHNIAVAILYLLSLGLLFTFIYKLTMEKAFTVDLLMGIVGLVTAY